MKEEEFCKRGVERGWNRLKPVPRGLKGKNEGDSPKERLASSRSPERAHFNSTTTLPSLVLVLSFFSSRRPEFAFYHARQRARPEPPRRHRGVRASPRQRRGQRRRSPARPQSCFELSEEEGRWERRRRRSRCGQVDEAHDVRFVIFVV